MVQTNQTLNPTENTLLFSIRALDCEGLVKILTPHPLQYSWLQESDIFHSLWQASHNGVGHEAQYDTQQRRKRVKIILRQLLSSGINPLNVPHFGGMPYVANWSMHHAGWGELAKLCHQHDMKTPKGGNFLHALCEQGLSAVKMIQRYMTAFGYPQAPDNPHSPWLELDQHGQTPCHVLWQIPHLRIWDNSGDLQAALQFTQWCVNQGVNPVARYPSLLELLDQRRDMTYMLESNDKIITQAISKMKRTVLMRHAPTLEAETDDTRVML